MYRLLLLTALLLALTGCGRNMYEQAKFEEDEPSSFFANGTSSRPLPEGAVSRSRGGIDEVFFTGLDEDGLVTEPPLEVTEAVLKRGQERYNIYCSPCHNYSGNGEGMIVQKGFVQPTSFHDPRLRAAPVGYFFGAITNGFGRMYPYASRVPPEDRWAIASYIKALQYSQNAPVDELPEGVREQLVEVATTASREAAAASAQAADRASDAAARAAQAASQTGAAPEPAATPPEGETP